VKQKVKNALIIITVVGLLGVAVSSSGCATPIGTAMTATWRGTGAPFKPGGLTVTGQLQVSPGVPFPYQTIQLLGTNDVTLQQTVLLTQTTTDSSGKFAFTISPSQDTYRLYATIFQATGYTTSLTLVGGYRGINYGIDSLVKNMATLPISTFGPGGKVALLAQLNAVKINVGNGQYSGAASTMDGVLRTMDAANATKGAPAALVNMDYMAYILTKDCRWLSGQPWKLPERPAPDNWTP
jgi:hypothetical protein